MNFLVWKDHFRKTVVHQDACLFFGSKEKSSCRSPRRLVYGSLNYLEQKFASFFLRLVELRVVESMLPSERVVQYSDKFMHSIVLYYIHITID